MIFRYFYHAKICENPQKYWLPQFCLNLMETCDKILSSTGGKQLPYTELHKQKLRNAIWALHHCYKKLVIHFSPLGYLLPIMALWHICWEMWDTLWCVERYNTYELHLPITGFSNFKNFCAFSYVAMSRALSTAFGESIQNKMCSISSNFFYEILNCSTSC